MADNVTINGKIYATEEVDGVQHQKVKVEFGSDGIATLVDSSNPLPVVQTGILSISGTVQPGNTANVTPWLMTASGDVESGATDAGNPVKVGARYNSTLPTLSNGQRGDLQQGTRGSLNATLFVPNSTLTLNTAADNGDGVAISSNADKLANIARNTLYNGTTWDRKYNNQDVSLLASAARTTTQTSADQINYQGVSAMVIVVNVTSAGTGSITVSIDGKDAVSSSYYNILTGAAITTNSTNVYRVGPHITAVTNSIALDYVPRTFRIVITANNANSVTYSVGYSLVRQS